MRFYSSVLFTSLMITSLTVYHQHTETNSQRSPYSRIGEDILSSQEQKDEENDSSRGEGRREEKK